MSLKDTVSVVGYDSCIGYSRWVGQTKTTDAPMIRLLRDAGAVPFVKTNVPTTLLSFESTNDVFGRTENPHVPGFSPGGSTGGEAALLALGGSRIGVGTDVAGSVRVPAAWCGIFALRCSTGRFPRLGNVTSMAGQEGVNAVYSPMARTVEDLGTFLRAVVGMRPWEYEHGVHPIPWREVGEEKVRWGVIRDDGVCQPTPAVARGLEEAVAALRSRGEEVVELDDVPSCFEALRCAARLLNSDAGVTYRSHFSSWWEGTDPGVALMDRLFALPRWVKKVYAFYLRLVGDTIAAGLVDDLRTRSVAEQWQLVAERESIRARWFEYIKREKGVDLILMPVHPLPGLPKGKGGDALGACGYTFLWNLLDWAAGVVPVGRVRKDDVVGGALAKEVWERGRVAEWTWELYDAGKMEGLPVAVQVVGGRLEEERVLWGMERVWEVCGKEGYGELVVEID